jgi:hypothetical protein
MPADRPAGRAGPAPVTALPPRACLALLAALLAAATLLALLGYSDPELAAFVGDVALCR